jgi:thiol-disulfide isomerase/thioredoxin
VALPPWVSSVTRFPPSSSAKPNGEFSMPFHIPRRTALSGVSSRPKMSAALLATVVGVVLTGCSSQDVDQTTPGAQYEFNGATPAGQVIEPVERVAAPAFDGELLDGARFDSTELAGDISVINFWGSWCAPCRIETPDFQAVYTDVRDEGVQFLGVDVKDDRQMADAFMDRVDAEYSSMFDPRGEVAMAFRGFPANVVPSTILLDAEGRVAAVYTGAVARDDLTSALTSLLEETEP